MGVTMIRSSFQILKKGRSGLAFPDAYTPYPVQVFLPFVLRAAVREEQSGVRAGRRWISLRIRI
jgi:hypothetical protein